MYGKLIIQCQLIVRTGMHIGASDSFSAIGAVDSPVVRDILTGDPIVPGSSLKGKLRTLLARSLCKDITNMPEPNNDDDRIKRLFGSSVPVKAAKLQFSDCFVSNKKELEILGRLTEVKFENYIKRCDSVANPRQIERVIPGTKFAVNIVYDMTDPAEVMEDMRLLAKGMKLLQLDYLGGHGTRGSGRVSFSDIKFRAVECEADIPSISKLFEELKEYELFSF